MKMTSNTMTAANEKDLKYKYVLKYEDKLEDKIYQTKITKSKLPYGFIPETSIKAWSKSGK